MWDDGVAAVDVASHMLGLDELNLSDEELEQIKQLWIDQREHDLFYWSGEPELVEAMASGNGWVAYAWQGAYALLRAQGVPVAYALLGGKLAEATARNDESALALFLAGPDPTLPVFIYGQLRFASRLPMLISLAVMVMAGTLTLAFVADRLRRGS